jgi:hypothetical protein
MKRLAIASFCLFAVVLLINYVILEAGWANSITGAMVAGPLFAWAFRKAYQDEI